MAITPQSDFLAYLVSIEQAHNGDQLPSLAEIGKQLGISVARLREQMEVARALGLIEVKPKTGIRLLPFQFCSTLAPSLSFAVSADPSRFQQFYDLRRHLEASYWYEAVGRLTESDKDDLLALLVAAENKLNFHPIQIPYLQHRQLHLTIYKRLDNVFVQGLLESYWELYDAIGYSLYSDEDYIRKVWRYHRKIVELICSGEYEAGYRTLRDHMDLLFQRKQAKPNHPFE